MNVYELEFRTQKKRSKIGNFINGKVKVENQSFFDTEIDSIEGRRCICVELGIWVQKKNSYELGILTAKKRSHFIIFRKSSIRKIQFAKVIIVILFGITKRLRSRKDRLRFTWQQQLLNEREITYPTASFYQSKYTCLIHWSIFSLDPACVSGDIVLSLIVIVLFHLFYFYIFVFSIIDYFLVKRI